MRGVWPKRVDAMDVFLVSLEAARDREMWSWITCSAALRISCSFSRLKKEGSSMDSNVC